MSSKPEKDLSYADIRMTTDYSRFKHHPEQRPIEERKRLEASMREHGFIPSYHITVNSNWEIVDGQHRFETAKKLGFPIYYTVEDIPINAVQQAGGASKAWTLLDYMNSYASQGKPGYVRFKKWAAGKNRSVQQLLRLVSANSGESREKFRTGRFEFDEAQEAEGDLILSILSDIIPYAKELANASYLLQAVTQMVRVPGFSRTRLREKLEYQSARITKQADPMGYLLMFESIYNYKSADKNRISFGSGRRRRSVGNGSTKDFVKEDEE